MATTAESETTKEPEKKEPAPKWGSLPAVQRKGLVKAAKVGSSGAKLLAGFVLGMFGYSIDSASLDEAELDFAAEQGGNALLNLYPGITSSPAFNWLMATVSWVASGVRKNPTTEENGPSSAAETETETKKRPEATTV